MKLPSMNKDELGSRIRELRKKVGLSQEALAGNAGIDRSTLQRIENAEISPTVETLWLLLPSLNAEMNIRHPLSEDEKKQPNIVNRMEQVLEHLEKRAKTIEEQEAKIKELEIEKLKKENEKLKSYLPKEFLIDPEVEKWQLGFARFFLTGKQGYLADVRKDVRDQVLGALKAYHLNPGRKAPGK